jgi:hypothetical protein
MTQTLPLDLDPDTTYIDPTEYIPPYNRTYLITILLQYSNECT